MAETLLANFKGEQSAKISALTLLTNLGYQFIPPNQCWAQRGNPSTVVLPEVLRGLLAKKTFSFMGKEHPLSPAAIDKIVHELSTPAMNEGLRAANEKLYNALTYGVGVIEFMDGKKASPTIEIIDWQTPENNVYHFTEEMEVENAQGTGKRIPDVVCFVNGLPWVVIEAKRPDSSTEGKPTVSEGISQNIRNQKVDEIPHLFAYSQSLLSVNGNDGLYGTCGTPEKFWAKWKEEEITETEFAELKNKALNGFPFCLLNQTPSFFEIWCSQPRKLAFYASFSVFVFIRFSFLGLHVTATITATKTPDTKKPEVFTYASGFGVFGGPRRTRTFDQRIMSPLL